MGTRTFDLHELVRSCVRAALPQARAKGLSLDLILGMDSPRWVRGRPEEAVRALSALISTAIGSSKQGGVTVRVEPAQESAIPSRSAGARISVQGDGGSSELPIPGP
jgi:signal transduction histidine kinase